MRDGDRDPGWPEGFFWSEEDERPTFQPDRHQWASEEESLEQWRSLTLPGPSPLPQDEDDADED